MNKNAKNECSHSAREVQNQIQQTLRRVAKARKEAGLKKLSSQVHQTKEAVINLQAHHTLEDVNRLAAEFEKLTGAQVYQTTVHKDEGVFIDWIGESEPDWDNVHFESDNLKWYYSDGREAPVISYKPNEDIFYNKNDDTWYQDRSFKKEAPVKDYRLYMNYHAHIVYSNLDDLGRSISRNFRNEDKMDQFHKLAADVLKMDIKPKDRKGKRNKSLNHRSLKKAISKAEIQTILRHKKAEEKKKYEATKTRLYNARNEARQKLKESGVATQQDYSKLKQEYERELDYQKELYLQEIQRLQDENLQLKVENEELKLNDKKQLNRILYKVAELVEYEGEDLNELEKLIEQRLDLKEKQKQANLGLRKDLNQDYKNLETSSSTVETIKEHDVDVKLRKKSKKRP